MIRSGRLQVFRALLLAALLLSLVGPLAAQVESARVRVDGLT